MNAPRDVVARPRTFREIIDLLPAHMTGQVIAGRLVVTPRPAPAHINAVGAWRGDATVRVEPFDALELQLRWLWA